MKIPASLVSFAVSKHSSLIAYLVIACIASIQPMVIGAYVGDDGFLYTDYNNYIIFRQSFFHLLEGKALYSHHPGEHWDLYKYSPAFAMFFGAFAWLPDPVGLTFWNILNALVLWIALQRLPISTKQRSFLCWFCLIELLTSMQSSQSNGLLAGLMILAITHMEKRRLLTATLWLVFATFIKVYGAAGFIIFLFYPQKLKFIAYSILWTFICLLLPLLVLSFPALMAQYHGWILMMSYDQATSFGISVMGWLQSWFSVSTLKNQVMVAGVLLFFLPLLHFRSFQHLTYRLLFMAHILIWIIIFNHKAESPTFIIAVAGVGIWYMVAPKTAWRKAILWLVFIGTCLTHTDLFPAFIRKEFIYPYVIKVVPCIVAWIAVMTDLLTLRTEGAEFPLKQATTS